jgi:acetoin utilization deacetylase AcuC-like enzyme
MILLTSTRFDEHVTPPGHPERMERAHVFDAAAARWMSRGGRAAAPRAARREELERVHDPGYVDRIARTAGHPSMLDEDTFTSPGSYEVALLAAGAAIDAVDHALDHREAAFALVRPPGHHAERDRAMGFCLFNNAAVAAAAALARGLDRVAVVDIDVHHGNGTQWMFYGDPRVLYISSHQFPFYPGTGAADEVGKDEGAGFTVNVPMEAGSTDADYSLVYRAIVGPVLDAYAPELLIVSVGYDAHQRDPLASMRVSTAGYAAIVGMLQVSVASHGSIALVTEGGYDLTALASCLDESFVTLDRGLSGARTLPDDGPAPRGERALAAVRAAQAPYWPAI